MCFICPFFCFRVPAKNTAVMETSCEQVHARITKQEKGGVCKGVSYLSWFCSKQDIWCPLGPPCSGVLSSTKFLVCSTNKIFHIFIGKIQSLTKSGFYKTGNKQWQLGHQRAHLSTRTHLSPRFNIMN